MSNLKALRQRITSVQSTVKITSAMKMVAASKLKRAQESQKAWVIYEKKLEEIVQETLFYKDSLEDFPSLFKKNIESQKVLLVIFTTQRGLCGPFNTNILKEAKKTIKKIVQDGKIIELLFVGKKGKDSLKHQFSEYFFKDEELFFENEKNEAGHVEKALCDLYEKNNYLCVKAIYNQYISVTNQETRIIDLLPLDIEPKRILQNVITEFENSPHEFLEDISQKILKNKVTGILVESDTGEQASRMLAMENATRSAKEILDHLKIKLNRSRQSLITKELIEVISGSEAV